jgi:hypothetical protein
MGVTEKEWLACGDPILSLEHERGWPSPRKQRLFALACCRRVAHLLRDDSDWEQAFAVAELYAERKAKRSDLKPFRAGGGGGVPWLGRTYADVRTRCAAEAAGWVCETSLRLYAAQAARAAACAVAYAAMPPNEPYVPPAESRYHQRWSDAERAEKKAQLALLREVWGDPFRPVSASLGRLPREAARLARAGYDESGSAGGELDGHRLAVLADALEEAGCTEEAVLGHLRGPGPHVRGCWALDLILGKS